MATTITDTDIREMMTGIYGNVVAAAVLSPFADAANLIVNEDIPSSAGLSQDRLDLIAVFLGCHFATIAMFQSGLMEVQKGQSTEKYAPPDGKAEGLKITHWGKQALAIDKSGVLAESTLASQNLPALFEVYTGRDDYDTNGARSDFINENDVDS